MHLPDLDELKHLPRGSVFSIPHLAAGGDDASPGLLGEGVLHTMRDAAQAAATTMNFVAVASFKGSGN